MIGPTPAGGERRFSRISFHRPARLDLGSARGDCELIDVSLKGALVEVGPGLLPRQGDRCALSIRLDAGDTVIRMDGVVAHVNGNRVGVECREVDLESVAHLRRLVELNLGDEALLHRELAALVNGRGRTGRA
ncbi:MAG TPA: PilZ domain-containing protein [Anaeromyxobacteraceae bacterium]|nr:PilZ domain-containing protein [Anaeromyxobacteraceae bacterium]